jgi:hypothetical protein
MTTKPKCDCCKRSAYLLDKFGLCLDCALAEITAFQIERQSDLHPDDCFDIAADIVERIKSEIMVRLIDQRQPPKQFIADVKRGMVPANAAKGERVPL